MKYWFIGLLSFSIVVNLLLFNRLFEMQQEINQLKTTSSEDSNRKKDRQSEPQAKDESITEGRTAFTDDIQKAESVSKPAAMASKDEKWKYLQFLRGKNRYEELLYEVQLFLRDYPQSLDGIMLEAEAIYYTKPLNVAIIHYYELRERELPRELMNEVEKFIEVHSTRTIQRFSGDANWAVLSAFLEPLIQVDPTNRSYIMSLAKSYGMEEQFSLMEDTLAALPFDDSRAERLRKNIYSEDKSKISSIDDGEAQIIPVQPNFMGKRVRLRRINNKLMARASVEREPLRLLVDTGASMTALKLSIQNKVSKSGEYLGIFRVQTAGGVISSPMYRVEEFYLGPNKLNNVDVMLIEDENLGDNDGLLGMNVLSKFDFVASNVSDDVFLKKK